MMRMRIICLGSPTAPDIFSPSRFCVKPVRVIAFNTTEGWAREVSEDIAREVAERAWHDGDTLSEGTRSFCECHGIVLPGAIAAE